MTASSAPAAEFIDTGLEGVRARRLNSTGNIEQALRSACELGDVLAVGELLRDQQLRQPITEAARIEKSWNHTDTWLLTHGPTSTDGLWIDPGTAVFEVCGDYAWAQVIKLDLFGLYDGPDNHLMLYIRSSSEGGC